jgi:thiosulfate dehydrogenase [quinone] large subunit
MTSTEVSVKAPEAAWAYMLLRATLGMNIMLHGVMRLVTGESKFVSSLAQTFQGTPLPQPLVTGFATVLPFVEATIGFMILTGLRTRPALTAAGVLMFVFTFGVGVRQNWEAAGLQLPYALVIAVLLAFVAANRYSLDALLRRRLN